MFDVMQDGYVVIPKGTPGQGSANGVTPSHPTPGKTPHPQLAALPIIG